MYTVRITTRGKVATENPRRCCTVNRGPRTYSRRSKATRVTVAKALAARAASEMTVPNGEHRALHRDGKERRLGAESASPGCRPILTSAP